MNLNELFDNNHGDVVRIAENHFMKIMIEEAGRRTNFNKFKMAEMLGIDRSTLNRKITESGAYSPKRHSPKVDKIELELYRMAKAEHKEFNEIKVLYDGTFYRIGSFKSGKAIEAAEFIHALHCKKPINM